MFLEKSSLYKEVATILQYGEQGVGYTYEAYLHVKTTKKMYLSPKVLSIDLERDYIKNFSDKMILTMVFTGGIYTHDIFPYKNDLEVLLVRKPIFLENSSRDYSRQAITEKFTAVLINTAEPTANSEKENPDKDTLDRVNMIELEFECMSKTAEEINMIMVGGIPRNTTPEIVLKTLLTNEACQGGNDKNIIVKGVDMVPADNQDVRDHIVIPQGIKLVDLPQYLQKKCGGIYATGIGYYLQERQWYVYPAFDYTRINNTTRTITFINIPRGKLPNVERTFRRQGSQIIALATGNIKIANDVDIKQRNKGNGVSFTMASSILHSMVKPGGNKAVIDRAASNTEVKTSERPDGKTYMPVSGNPITDNSMEEFSKIAAQQAGVISLVWENSDPSAIVPGLMVRVYTMDKDNVIDLVGVVGGVHHYTFLREKGATGIAYGHSSLVTIFYDTKALGSKDSNGISSSSSSVFDSKSNSLVRASSGVNKGNFVKGGQVITGKNAARINAATQAAVAKNSSKRTGKSLTDSLF